MAIAVTLPTVTSSETDSILGRKCIFAFLSDADGATQENYKAKIASISAPEATMIESEDVDDTTGYLVPDRTVVSKRKITITLTMDKLTSDLMNFLNAVYRSGTGRLWIKDPADAPDTAALLSNAFTCRVMQEGSIDADREKFIEPKLKIETYSTFTLSKTADISGT